MFEQTEVFSWCGYVFVNAISALSSLEFWYGCSSPGAENEVPDWSILKQVATCNEDQKQLWGFLIPKLHDNSKLEKIKCERFKKVVSRLSPSRSEFIGNDPTLLWLQLLTYEETFDITLLFIGWKKNLFSSHIYEPFRLGQRWKHLFCHKINMWSIWLRIALLLRGTVRWESLEPLLQLNSWRQHL